MSHRPWRRRSRSRSASRAGRRGAPTRSCDALLRHAHGERVARCASPRTWHSGCSQGPVAIGRLASRLRPRVSVSSNAASSLLSACAPKTFARIARFQQVAGLLDAEPRDALGGRHRLRLLRSVAPGARRARVHRRHARRPPRNRLGRSPSISCAPVGCRVFPRRPCAAGVTSSPPGSWIRLTPLRRRVTGLLSGERS